MEKRMIELQSSKNKNIKIGIVPGHFATNHSHVNYYVDLNAMKKKLKMSKETAREIASKYMNTPIDTIICLEQTQVVGAFLADELSTTNLHGLNYNSDINVITPEMNNTNQMIFRDDSQNMIWNKRIILLISSASTGWTINRSVECLKYYGGELVGVTALFSAIDETNEISINSVFSLKDIPDYSTHSPATCPMCTQKMKVDALVNAHGYSKI